MGVSKYAIIILMASLVLLLGAYAVNFSPLSDYFAVLGASSREKPLKMILLTEPMITLEPCKCGLQGMKIDKWIKLVPGKGVSYVKFKIEIADIDIIASMLRLLYIEVINKANGEVLGTLTLNKPELITVIDSNGWMSASNGSRYTILSANIYYAPRKCLPFKTSIPVIVVMSDAETGTVYISYQSQAPASLNISIPQTMPPYCNNTVQQPTSGGGQSQGGSGTATNCTKIIIVKREIYITLPLSCFNITCGQDGCIARTNLTLFLTLSHFCGCIASLFPLKLKMFANITNTSIINTSVIKKLAIEFFDILKRRLGMITLPVNNSLAALIDRNCCVIVRTENNIYNALEINAHIEVRVDKNIDTNSAIRIRLGYNVEPDFCEP